MSGTKSKVTDSARCRALELELRNFATECARIADSLTREIMTGRCIRQSPESKQARVDILRLHADWANRLLTPDNNK